MAFQDSDSKDYLNLKWSTATEKEQKTEEIARTKITPRKDQKKLGMKTSQDQLSAKDLSEMLNMHAAPSLILWTNRTSFSVSNYEKQ